MVNTAGTMFHRLPISPYHFKKTMIPSPLTAAQSAAIQFINQVNISINNWSGSLANGFPAISGSNGRPDRDAVRASDLQAAMTSGSVAQLTSIIRTWQG
jgi:hypothetical protein